MVWANRKKNKIKKYLCLEVPQMGQNMTKIDF